MIAIFRRLDVQCDTVLKLRWDKGVSKCPLVPLQIYLKNKTYMHGISNIEFQMIILCLGRYKGSGVLVEGSDVSEPCSTYCIRRIKRICSSPISVVIYKLK